MKSMVLVAVVLHSALAIEGLLTCSKTSVRCINSNQYVFCIKNIKGEGVLVGNVLSCPDNSVCNENDWFPCVRVSPTPPPPTTIKPTTLEQTTPVPTTLEPTTPEPTTMEPTTPEPTTMESTTPEPTTLEPTTPEPTTLEPTTPEPTTLEPTTPEEPKTPETATPEPTTPDPTTTEKPTTIKEATTLPPIKLPDCSQTGAGKYPSAKCNEYLECVKNWWWYDLNRVSCPKNQLYDTTARKCAPSETVKCLQRTI